jgi:hypothetical protein
MSVFVDRASNPYGRMKMSHMVADTPEELHAMADKIGVNRKWFQDNPDHPHYDICQSKKKLAMSFGAIEIYNSELVILLRKMRMKQPWSKEPPPYRLENIS